MSLSFPEEMSKIGKCKKRKYIIYICFKMGFSNNMGDSLNHMDSNILFKSIKLSNYNSLQKYLEQTNDS